MAANMLRLRMALRNALTAATNDRGFPANKLLGMADLFGMSPDEFNNLIYGRVCLDDSFVTEVYKVLRTHSPDIARNFLREYFMDLTVIFQGDAVPQSLSIEDLHTLVLRVNEQAGILSGEHANAIEDGQMDMFECDAELTCIRTLRKYLDIYESTIFNRKAELIRTGAINPNGRRNNNHGKKNEPIESSGSN